MILYPQLTATATFELACKIRKNVSSETFSMTHVHFSESGFDSWYISNNMTLVNFFSMLVLLSTEKEENKSIYCVCILGEWKKESFLSVYKSRLLFSFSGRFRFPPLPLALYSLEILRLIAKALCFFLKSDTRSRIYLILRRREKWKSFFLSR